MVSMAQINRTCHRKLNRNWIEINRGTETRKKQEPEVSHVESRSIHQKLRLILGSNSLGISFFGTLLLMFLKKMEKEFGDKPKTNNIWYINHSPWTAKIVFDYEKLHLNCIFTLCVNTCMRRFEIRESIQKPENRSWGLSITCKKVMKKIFQNCFLT